MIVKDVHQKTFYKAMYNTSTNWDLHAKIWISMKTPAQHECYKTILT